MNQKSDPKIGIKYGFIANNVLKELSVERIDGIDINLQDFEIKIIFITL